MRIVLNVLLILLALYVSIIIGQLTFWYSDKKSSPKRDPFNWRLFIPIPWFYIVWEEEWWANEQAKMSP